MNIQDISQGKQIGDYLICKELGEGSFGKVFEGVHLVTKENVAIKAVQKKHFSKNPKVLELFITEQRVLEKIQNQNVVGFRDYFENPNICFLVIEYCNGGDMEHFLDKKQGKRLPEEEALAYFKQILNGFKGLHEHNVIHRDLKLANLLLHSQEIKIADLGFAKELKDEKALARTILGTSLTMAPEVLEGKQYGLDADIYSLGVIFYQMLFGRFPYVAQNDPALVQKIKSQSLKLDYLQISPMAKDLLSRMIVYDRSKRITWPQIYQHTLFLQQNGDLTKSINIAAIRGQQIDMQQNQQFYEKYDPKKQQQILEQKFNQQQQQKQNKYQNQNNIPVQSFNDIEELQKIMDQNQNKKQLEQEFQNIMSLYFNEKNIYGMLSKTIVSAQMLPATQINTFIPNFLIAKKLLAECENLLYVMRNKQNVFSCSNMDYLFNSKEYQLTLVRVQEDYEMIKIQYDALKFDVQDMLRQMKNPNPAIQFEIDNNKFGNNFKNLYTETLVNYQLSLSEERESKKMSMEDRRKFTVHMIQVLDSLIYEKVFRNQKVFDSIRYWDDINNSTEEQINSKIQEKFGKIYE